MVVLVDKTGVERSESSRFWKGKTFHFSHIRHPRESKHTEVGRRNLLDRSALSFKSEARFVRRVVYRPIADRDSREALSAEYQRLVDIRLHGELSELERLRLANVEAKLDRLDLERADHVGALHEYARDIAKMDDLLRLGERLQELIRDECR